MADVHALPAPVLRWRQRFAQVPTDTAWCIAGGALVLLVCLVAGQALLNDPDTQWHVAAGRWMIEHRALPHTDMLSHTFAGAAWIAKEWLSQIMLATAFLVGGWPMVAALTAFAVGLSIFLLMHHVARQAGPVAGVALGALAFSLIAATVVARPHALVFPILVGWTLCLVRSAETTRMPPWHALPLLALWVNMHAGFTMGILIAGAFGLEALLRAAPQDRLATLARWAAFGVACFAMGLLTPYGAAPLLLNVTMAGGNEAIPFIAEWRSLPATPGTLALLALAAASIFVLAKSPQENAGRILLLVVLTYAMVRHQRFAMIFGLVAPILAGAGLWALARDLCARFGIFQQVMGMPPGVTSHRAAGTLAAAAAVAMLANTISLPDKVAPAAALASVPAAVRAEPAFNSYNLGGFLANNGVRTFIDGRTDQLFLGGFITRVDRAITASEPAELARLLDQYKVQWAIISAEMSEALLFGRLQGWKPVYKDRFAAVYVRMAP